MNQKKYEDFGAAWEKQNQYGTLISLCVPVEYLQVLLADAVNGKVWLSLAQNTSKKAGTKQPDWRVLGPRKKQEFNPYSEQLSVAPTKKWEAPKVEDDVPTDWAPMKSEEIPF